MLKPILFFSTGIILSAACTQAQGNFFSEGTVQINAGASIEIMGNTVLDNQVDGDGAMVMLGTTVQKISGNDVSMHQLVLRNNAEVHLLNDAYVEDSLHLTSGRLYIDDAEFFLGNGSTSTGNASGFMIAPGNGHIYRQINTNAFTFHVGHGNEYFPLTLAENGTPDIFSLRTRDFLPDNGTFLGSPVTSHVATFCYLLSDNTAGGNDLDLIMQWNDSKNAPDFVQAYATGIRYNVSAYEELSPCPVNVSTIDPNIISYQHIHNVGTFGIGDSTYATHIPSAAILPGDSSICQGSTINFTASPAGTHFNWSTGDSAQVINTGTGGIYWVEITDTTGCTYRSNEITLTLLPVPPAPVISQSGNQLTATPAGFLYQWYLDGNPIAGATTQNHTVTGNGNYSVVITDPNGCTNTSAYNFNTFGIEEEAQQINIFSSGENLYIHITGDELRQVSIYDISGKLVYQMPYTTNIIPLVLAKGIYVARIKGDKKEYTRKMIF